jgi:hypothetical protein
VLPFFDFAQAHRAHEFHLFLQQFGRALDMLLKKR